MAEDSLSRTVGASLTLDGGYPPLSLMNIGTYFARTYHQRKAGRLEIPMQRFMTAIGLCGVIFAGAHAVAAPPASQSVILKRQLYGCMVRRMGADKALSYNQAMRGCKERIQPAKEALASIAPDSGKTH